MVPEDFPYPAWFAAAYRQFRHAGLDPLLFDLQTALSGTSDTRRIGFHHRDNPDIRFAVTFVVRPADPAAVLSASSVYSDVTQN